MKNKIYFFQLCAMTLLSFGTLTAQAHSSHHGLTEQEAYQLGKEAYIYAYPLIATNVMKQTMANASTVPMGQFKNMREYPDVLAKEVSTINLDTLYSIAWVDLDREPYILHIPDVQNRYYEMSMLSAWTEVFATIDAKNTAGKAQDVMLIGPHWKGMVPPNVTPIHAPTNRVWLIGRTYCTGTPADYQAVHAIQDGYKLSPLSLWHSLVYVQPEIDDINIDVKDTVNSQIEAMDTPTYFKKFIELLAQNPPAPEDAPMLEKLKKLHIEIGRNFALTELSPKAVRGLNAGIQAARKEIMVLKTELHVIRNGWIYPGETGHYGTDYLQRAHIAAIGLGAIRSEDVIYPIAFNDSDDKKLTGKNHYILHFEKDNLPPVQAFWSIALYDPHYFFVANPINRYTLNSQSPLKFNQDGSLDLYVQHKSPGLDKESNWLPTPTDDFLLMLRFYEPQEALVNGVWVPPRVQNILTLGKSQHRMTGWLSHKLAIFDDVLQPHRRTLSLNEPCNNLVKKPLLALFAKRTYYNSHWFLTAQSQKLYASIILN